MKKTLIAMAALAATGAFAQSSVTIDGLVDAGFQANKYKGVSVNGFDQNGAGTTQFNLKGTEDLGGGLKANFRLENDFSVVNNNANQGVVPTGFTATGNAGVNSKFGNGELRVGLSGGFGTVNFGAINNGGLDFVATVSPIQGTSFGGGYGSIIGADPSYGVVRWSNSMQYTTPMISGFNASYIRAQKQTKADITANVNFVEQVGRFNVLGADELTARYANGPLTAIAVFTKTDASGTSAAATGVKKTQNSFGLGYQVTGDIKVTGGYQTMKADAATAGGNTDDRKSYIFGGYYAMGPATLMLTYGSNKQSGVNATYNGMTSKMTAFGVDYALSKKTKLYARYESLKDDSGVISLQTLVGADTSRNRTRSALGIRYDF